MIRLGVNSTVQAGFLEGVWQSTGENVEGMAKGGGAHILLLGPGTRLDNVATPIYPPATPLI